MGKFIDLTSIRFERLVVVCRIDRLAKRNDYEKDVKK